jgi:hypothetical protein
MSFNTKTETKSNFYWNTQKKLGLHIFGVFLFHVFVTSFSGGVGCAIAHAIKTLASLCKASNSTTFDFM